MLLGLVEVLVTSNSVRIISVFWQVIIAFWVHRFFLKGEDYFASDRMFSGNGSFNQKGRWKFMFVSAIFVLVPISLAWYLVLMVPDVAESKERFKTGLALFTMPIYWVVLGLFGTVLPAIADGDTRYSLVAGIKKAPILMFRLVIGPTAMGAVYLAFFMVLSFAVNSITQVSSDVWEVVSSIVGPMFGLFNMILAVATLCSVYRMIVPAPEPSLAE
jgi:hypothetical protein